MSKDWERHSLCCEQLWETGECDCEARDVMRVTAGLPKRAPHTLSERIRLRQSARLSKPRMVNATVLNDWADEVAALEAELEECKYGLAVVEASIDLQAELTPVDKLNQGYERAGLSSAIVVNNKYGKHSAFGYMGRE